MQDTDFDLTRWQRSGLLGALYITRACYDAALTQRAGGLVRTGVS